MSGDYTETLELSELIQHIKQELLTQSPDRNNDIPLFSVDSVELELQVTVKKEAKGGLKLYVAEAGTTLNQENIQKIKLTLSPLLDKETLLKIYKSRYPEKWKEFLKTGGDALTKGGKDNLDEQL